MNPKLLYPVRGICIFCSGKLFRIEDSVVCYKCYYNPKCPSYLKEKKKNE